VSLHCRVKVDFTICHSIAQGNGVGISVITVHSKHAVAVAGEDGLAFFFGKGLSVSAHRSVHSFSLDV
jgi:hypothetical protein